MDRRSDVGSKLFTAVVASLLSAIFLGALGISVRNMELIHMQSERLVRLEEFAKNQDSLNLKLTDILEGRARLPNVFYPPYDEGAIRRYQR